MLFNINVKNKKRLDGILPDFLEIFAVNGFALAQPIYSLMSRNAEFFTAHHFFKLDFLNLVLTLGLAVPLALLVVELALGLILGYAARKAVHVGILLFGLALVFLPTMDNLFADHMKMPILAALGCAACVLKYYVKSANVRSYLRLLAIGALLFPLYFLFLTPIRRMFFSPTKFSKAAFKDDKNPHIFLMVFDEFNAMALLNDKREIDPVRFPNFAALAREALWFPKASSVSSATILAVPAVLSGLQPREDRRVPSISDHPKNLFTMLANHYRMNVIEPYTGLFPPLLDNVTWKKESTLQRYKSSMADLWVVYHHIMYPKPLRERLPSITHTFRGFARSSKSDPDNTAIQSQNGYDRDERRKQILEFIKNIRNSKEPSLNFLHVLLPHHFHDYLPSGQFYCEAQLMDGQLLPANAWCDNQDLADLSYQRFVLQVGFVDRMLGEVIAKIKAEGMYDNSAIVLVGDHGICFQAGQPIRPLSDVNFPEILSIPLMIKLPHQKEGKKDLRYAESTDIVPTLLDAMGATVDWKLDGHSLASGELPERKVKHLFDLDTKTWKDYDFAAITAYPRLAHAMEVLGSDKPLDNLHRITSYEEIMGKPLESLSPQQAPEFLPDVHQWSLFKNEIDPENGFLPLYISGHVDPMPAIPPPYDVAVCVNGVVSGVARTYPSGYENVFKSLLPKTALRKGKNTLSVALLQKNSPSGLRVLVNNMATSSPFKLCDAEGAHPYILTATNEKIQIAPGIVMGALEPFKPNSSLIMGTGWAICEKMQQPAQKIILFADNEYLATLPVTVDREDIKGWLGEPFLTCGFNTEVPGDPMMGCEIRAYGVAGNGWASELDNYRIPGDPKGIFERFCYYGAAKLEKDGQGRPVVAMTNGRKLECKSANCQGALEKTESKGDYVHAVGWAANTNPAAPPKAILFFHNGTLVAVRRAGIARDDIAKQFNWKNPLACGFDGWIAKKDFIAAGDLSPLAEVGQAMKVYAAFHDGGIYELKRK